MRQIVDDLDLSETAEKVKTEGVACAQKVKDFMETEDWSMRSCFGWKDHRRFRGFCSSFPVLQKMDLVVVHSAPPILIQQSCWSD